MGRPLPNTVKYVRTLRGEYPIWKRLYPLWTVWRSASRAYWSVFDIPGKEKETEALEKQAGEPSFWEQPEQAQVTMRRLARLKETVDTWRSLERKVSELRGLSELASEEPDDSLSEQIATETTEASDTLADLEFQLMLSGPYDDRNAILSIRAGAGGTDSQDWTEMLLRMYLRWAERRGFSSGLLDSMSGEEAGIKSAALEISGNYAYGYLRAERGVHRLVRLSPFDADHARHTSFAMVEVLPEAEGDVEVNIHPEDIKAEFFRSSGPGGQNVNKLSTAVRLTHVPTGIVVACQSERSQHQNREIAMRILRARLMEQEMARRAEEEAKLRGGHVSAEWGNQIRSYVLHPYHMVKDHRTNCETGNTDAVLDGDIDEFLKAYLASTVGEG
jgi:peptide chain release factor 2